MTTKRVLGPIGWTCRYKGCCEFGIENSLIISFDLMAGSEV